MHFHIVKMYKDKEVTKNVKDILFSMCDVKIFLTFTSRNMVLHWQLFTVLLYFTGQLRNLTLAVFSHFTGWSHVSEYHNYSLCTELSPLLCTLTSLWEDGHQYQQKIKSKQRWSTIPPISIKVRCYITYMQVHNIIPSSYFEKHTSYIAKHKTSNMYQQ